MDEDVLKAARVRAGESGTTPSRVIADAARTLLIDNPQNAEARVLVAVERVFTLIQRNDKRRSFDQQMLKEMVGLMVQSFFNHTPGIPEKDKKAALHSGKARFNRFLDTLAANLRRGHSIMNDTPPAENLTLPDSSAPTAVPPPTSNCRAAVAAEKHVANKEHEDREKKVDIEKESRSQSTPADNSSPNGQLSSWDLFGTKES